MKKIISTIIVILGAILVIHTIMYLIPGDPAQALAGEYASASDVEQIRNELGLNQGYWARYFSYVKNIFQLNLGSSIYSNRPVLDEIISKFPATFLLAVVAIVFASIIGLLSGITAALNKDNLIDKTILWISSLTISTPIFVTCILMVFIFSFILGIFPPSGKDGLNFAYLVLPAMSLGSRSIALIVRVVRNEFLQIINKQYILMARTMGFSRFKVIFVFALKNILIPVLTIILLDFGAYLGGAVVTESVFSWPGLGRLLMVALQKRDLPVIQGIIIFGTLLFVFINITIDILKIRISGKQL